MENHSGGQTTTRTTVTETQVQTNLRFDPSYLRTVPGILKLGALVRFYLPYKHLYVQFDRTLSKLVQFFLNLYN